MRGATASRNPCTCSHRGRKLSLPSKRSSTVTAVPGCVCGKGLCCNWGWTMKPLHKTDRPRPHADCVLLELGISFPNPALPTPAPAPKVPGRPRRAAFSSALSLPKRGRCLPHPATTRPLPDLVDVFQQVAEAVRAVKEPVHHDDRLVGSTMGRGDCREQQQRQEGQQAQDPRSREPRPPEPQHAVA